MKLYNKEGAEALFEKDQVQLMLDSGWSKTPFEVEETDEESGDKKEETGEKTESDSKGSEPAKAQVPKKILKPTK